MASQKAVWENWERAHNRWIVVVLLLLSCLSLTPTYELCASKGKFASSLAKVHGSAICRTGLWNTAGLLFIFFVSHCSLQLLLRLAIVSFRRKVQMPFQLSDEDLHWWIGMELNSFLLIKSWNAGIQYFMS